MQRARRPCDGATAGANVRPVSFHEYCHGDDGRGLGASHQTGWTALAANLLELVADARARRDLERRSNQR